MHQLLKATVSHRPASPDSLNLARPRACARAYNRPADQPRPTVASFKLESRGFTATWPQKLVTAVTFQIGSHSPAMFAREMRKGIRVRVTGTKCTPRFGVGDDFWSESPLVALVVQRWDLMTNVGVKGDDGHTRAMCGSQSRHMTAASHGSRSAVVMSLSWHRIISRTLSWIPKKNMYNRCSKYIL